MRDYTKLVPRTPPDGFWEWACNTDRKDEDGAGSLDTFGLVYEKVFLPDRSLHAILCDDGRERKIPMVRCTCSACGESFDFDYAPASAADGATYGFLVEEAGGVSLAASGNSWLCPVCGSPVSIRCKSKVRRDTYAECEAFVCSETYHMSVALLSGEPGRRPLVLTGWCLRRYCRKNGSNQNVVLPYDAYVFDGEECWKLTGNCKSYSGTAVFFTAFTRQWRKTKTWTETWGEDRNIYGLTEDLLEDSCLHNAKFLEYMRSGLRGSCKFPVPYLRLYQEHPHVENLVTQGATYLLDSLMAEQMKGHIWEKNVRGLMVLEDIDWDESRPSAMLGLNRDEFFRMRANCWCPELLRLYLACRDAGEFLTDRDITSAFQLGEVEELAELAGTVSVAKIVRYLHRQIELDGEKYLYDPEIDIYVDPEEFTQISVTMLRDYWKMAATAGWNLDDPAVRWPKALEAAHDRAQEAASIPVEEHSRELFMARYRQLNKFRFIWGGLMIRPCRSEKELVAEGEALHHCVGTYAKSVAAGEKVIFFIRRAKAPRTPWYTLELDEKKLRVVQNRGKRNCGKTPEVQAFEDLWVQWIQDGAKRDAQGKPVLPATIQSKQSIA